MKNFIFSKILLVCLALVVLSQLVNGQVKQSKKVSPYSLSNLEVTLYSQRQNKFLSKIENDGKDFFWNELNLSLFIAVEVSGEKGTYTSNRKVEVTAFEGKKVILKRSADLGVIDEATGKYYVPIWLYGPFCQKVTIKAQILGQNKVSSIERKLNFQCGE